MKLFTLIGTTLAISATTTLGILINSQPVQAATISTSFEDSAELPLGSSNFVIENSDISATFTGEDTMTNTIGNPDFYRTGTASWMIGDGVIGGGTVGSIEFADSAQSVQFFAINGGNGAANINVFDSNNMLLSTEMVVATNMSDADSEFNFNFADISLITITNPGPAGMPPYTTFVDDFSADIADNVTVPEPSSLLALIGLGSLLGLGRYRKKLK